MPAEVVARARAAGLDRRERPLATTRAEDGTWLLGTRRHLVMVASQSPASEEVTLVPWEQVRHAEWDQEGGVLRVHRAGETEPGGPTAAEGEGTTTAYVLADPRDFLRFLRERVTASLVLQHRVEIVGRRGVTVVARRSPTGDGPIRLTREVDDGVDLQDPAVRLVADAAVRDAEDMLGMG